MKIWSKHKEPLLVFSFVFILSLFLFGNFLGAGYVLDDHSVIENRTELRSFFDALAPKSAGAGQL